MNQEFKESKWNDGINNVRLEGSMQLSRFDSRREACSVAAEHARTSRPGDRAGTVLGTRAYRGYHQAREHRAARAAEWWVAAERPHRSSETD